MEGNGGAVRMRVKQEERGSVLHIFWVQILLFCCS